MFRHVSNYWNNRVFGHGKKIFPFPVTWGAMIQTIRNGGQRDNCCTVCAAVVHNYYYSTSTQLKLRRGRRRRLPCQRRTYHLQKRVSCTRTTVLIFWIVDLRMSYSRSGGQKLLLIYKTHFSPDRFSVDERYTVVRLCELCKHNCVEVR
jgi:hypothetical protein